MMKKLIITIVFFLVSFFQLASQNNKILDVFENQLNAFNQGNIDQMVDNVSDDFKYLYITSDELIKEVEGKEEFRKSMDAYFGREHNVLSKILSYSIVGNRISFTEEAGHINANGDFVSSKALGIYEIENGKIRRSWYFID